MDSSGSVGIDARRVNTMTEPSVKRGDIFYADLSPVVGSEQGGTRPVLIVQNDTGNRHSPTVIAAAITSQTGKARLPTHINIAGGSVGLSKDSIILLEQIRTIDKRRLGKRIGMLDKNQIKAIDKAISASVSNDVIDRMFTEKDIQVLCPACAAKLRESGEYIVLRADPFQIEHEACSICNKPDGIPDGYDYFVKKKQQ